MSDPITVKQVDAFNGHCVLITLSDNRVLLLTLDQILSANPKELPDADEQEQLDRSLPE